MLVVESDIGVAGFFIGITVLFLVVVAAVGWAISITSYLKSIERHIRYLSEAEQYRNSQKTGAS